MTVNIAVLADPHLCVQARRRNVLSLLSRRTWQSIDVSVRPLGSSSSAPFSLLKPTSYDDTPLLAAADFLQEFSREIDLLLVLGDLATTGQDEDLSVARDIFLERIVKEHLTASLEPRFGGLGFPLCVVPGNHDRYQDDFATPGGQRFDEVFRDVYKPISGVQSVRLTSEEVSICIVTADFCFSEESKPALWKRWGRGAVDGKVLSELDRQTRVWQKENPGKPVIWALHFSPADGVSSSLVLEEREQVVHLAQVLGVKHIFCGHTHLRKREIGSHPHIYCSGSVSSIDSVGSHFLHLCRVEKVEDGSFSLEVFDFRYDDRKDEFLLDRVSLEA